MFRRSVGLIGLLLFACSNKNSNGAKPDAAVADASASAAPSASAPPIVDPRAAPNLNLMTTWTPDIGLKTPDGVVFDARADRYLVSNLNLKEGPGKGFISFLRPTGLGFQAQWIVSDNVHKLNAPKGLAIGENVLLIADVDTVHVQDLNSGTWKSDIKVPGAVALSDIAVLADGTILVADSGTTFLGDGGVTKGPAAIFAIKDKKVTTVTKADDLHRPSGLVVAGDKTWVVGSDAKELFTLDGTGKKGDAQTLPTGGLYGLTMSPKGDLFISSRDGQSVLRGKPGGTFSAALTAVQGPGHLAYDTKRDRLLVIVTKYDELKAYDVH